jgi:hypothetical protein
MSLSTVSIATCLMVAIVDYRGSGIRQLFFCFSKARSHFPGFSFIEEFWFVFWAFWMLLVEILHLVVLFPQVLIILLQEAMNSVTTKLQSFKALLPIYLHMDILQVPARGLGISNFGFQFLHFLY